MMDIFEKDVIFSENSLLTQQDLDTAHMVAVDSVQQRGTSILKCTRITSHCLNVTVIYYK